MLSVVPLIACSIYISNEPERESIKKETYARIVGQRGLQILIVAKLDVSIVLVLSIRMNRNLGLGDLSTTHQPYTYPDYERQKLTLPLTSSFHSPRSSSSVQGCGKPLTYNVCGFFSTNRDARAGGRPVAAAVVIVATAAPHASSVLSSAEGVLSSAAGLSVVSAGTAGVSVPVAGDATSVFPASEALPALCTPFARVNPPRTPIPRPPRGSRSPRLRMPRSPFPVSRKLLSPAGDLFPPGAPFVPSGLAGPGAFCAEDRIGAEGWFRNDAPALSGLRVS